MKRNTYKVTVEATVRYSAEVQASDIDEACDIAEVLYDQGYLRPDICTRCKALEFLDSPVIKDVTREIGL